MPTERCVDVVILNYKTPQLTIDAVESCLGEPELHEVLVLDNASGDDSVRVLSDHFEGKPVRVIASEKNLGFAGGNNLAVRQSNAPYFFMLNSDATIEPGCLGPLVETMEKNPDIGLAQPMVLWPDRNTIQHPSMQGKFPTAKRYINRSWHRPPMQLEPDWVSAVALMARTRQFLDLGGFDEDFFMYYEDVELSYRYRKAGLRLRLVLGPVAIHHESMSKRSNWVKQKQVYRSMDRCLRKIGTSEGEIFLCKLLRIPYMLFKAVRGSYSR
jgi:GT2 family glycosyltransferase